MIYIVIRKKDRKVMQIKNIKEVQDGYSHHNGLHGDHDIRNGKGYRTRTYGAQKIADPYKFTNHREGDGSRMASAAFPQ